jgi:peroxiredoxin/predicted 2-oxoglutarate/Fe(II)-dependent dioxygenase YbiX
MPLPLPGEPAPPFRADTHDGRPLTNDSLAGRFSVLCFFGSAGVDAMAEMVSDIASNQDLFNGEDFQFVGISIDPDDTDLSRLPPPGPGVRYVWDLDQSLSQTFGAIEPPAPDLPSTEDSVSFQPLSILLDASLRVISVHKIDDPANHPAALTRFVGALPAVGAARPAQPQAPVLIAPMVFELDLCRRLIAHFEEVGGKPSGILEDDDAQTVLAIDPTRKQRLDAIIADETLRNMVHARIQRRLLPEIKKAFQFDVTRMERSVVARYETGEFFGPHRDNAALGTAHRRFAITIPLNAEAFAGGLLRFPEFGPLVYPIPSGCALVHSCGLLHETTPVTEGTRYAFIPIVYNKDRREVV